MSLKDVPTAEKQENNQEGTGILAEAETGDSAEASGNKERVI